MKLTIVHTNRFEMCQGLPCRVWLALGDDELAYEVFVRAVVRIDVTGRRVTDRSDLDPVTGLALIPPRKPQ